METAVDPLTAIGRHLNSPQHYTQHNITQHLQNIMKMFHPLQFTVFFIHNPRQQLGWKGGGVTAALSSLLGGWDTNAINKCNHSAPAERRKTACKAAGPSAPFNADGNIDKLLVERAGCFSRHTDHFDKWTQAVFHIVKWNSFGGYQVCRWSRGFFVKIQPFPTTNRNL